jgi:hypothetical protein
MKKIFLSFFAVGSFAAISNAQLPNPGFETWMNMGSYENPDGWATLNDYTTSASIYTATKGTPGSPGASYLKLTSQTVGPSVVNGIAVSGVIDPVTQQAVSGFAFSQQPASFNGKWQHMIYGSSQGSINVSLTRWDAGTNSRVIVAMANKTLTGMAMSWTNFSIPFVYSDGQAPDSCIIVMKASGSNPTQNDYLWVDNLSFVGNVAGINEIISPFAEMSIYPNPADDHVVLNLNSLVEDKLNLDVYTLAGALMLSQKIEVISGQNSIPIDLSELRSGNYLISVGNEEAKSVLSITIR